MQRLLPLTTDEEKAMQALEAYLKPRIEAAEHGKVFSAPIHSIIAETRSSRT
jgi:Antitoxin ParD